jgi:hypothetical protein
VKKIKKCYGDLDFFMLKLVVVLTQSHKFKRTLNINSIEGKGNCPINFLEFLRQ